MTLTLDFSVFGQLTEDQFFEFCQRNQQVKFERTSRGEVKILTPTGGETGWRNSQLTAQLVAYARCVGGRAFDSNTGFILPNRAMRSPDGAWVSENRWQGLSAEQRRKFPPLCPDLVVELLSDPDDLTETRAKMEEWVENGARLGWLLDPFARRVEVYRPGVAVEVLESPRVISAGEGFVAFELDLEGIV